MNAVSAKQHLYSYEAISAGGSEKRFTFSDFIFAKFSTPFQHISNFYGSKVVLSNRNIAALIIKMKPVPILSVFVYACVSIIRK